MIEEHALLTIVAGQEDAFVAAYAQARPLLLQSGATSATVSRCVEHSSRFLLLATWPTIEAHTEGFRGSAAFLAWRALLGPFFASDPEVTHYSSVALP
jgi:heme-degrading monooxygenase HmoA